MFKYLRTVKFANSDIFSRVSVNSQYDALMDNEKQGDAGIRLSMRDRAVMLFATASKELNQNDEQAN